MKRQRKTAFTLVELLVVIAIIGMLVGLLLPAINAARESGRRIACMNNVKQIALALNNHISSYGYLPAGATLSHTPVEESFDPWAEAGSKAKGSFGWSWMLNILPFMEHQEIYNQWNFTESAGANLAVAERDVKEFYCPSRRNGMRPGDQTLSYAQITTGGTDYGGCMGQVDGFVNATNPSGSHSFDDMEFLAPAYVPLTVGVFYPNSNTTLNQITDGASHTIMVGEMQRLHPPGAVPEGENNAADYMGGNTSADGWAFAGVGNLFDCNQAGGFDQGELGGFNCPFFEAAGSEHVNGANFAYVDGSVNFFNENVDSRVYAYLGSMADGVNAAGIPGAVQPY